MDNKISAAIAVVSVIIIAVIVAVTMAGKDANDISVEITDKEASTQFQKAVSVVSVTEKAPNKTAMTFNEVDAAVELPGIDQAYPIVSQPRNNKSITLEIWTSPEKGGSGMDSWLKDLTDKFNSESHDISGKSVGIKLRSISSGTMLDYIIPGVAVPDAITPSASMWAEMLGAQGIKTDCVNPRMVGNVAGLLISNSDRQALENNYNAADINSVVQATEKGEITAGYTNPFASTSGLNFLAATLYSYDDSNPLSDKAISGFASFQNNVPFVALNTMQMRLAAESSTFSTMILEYQTYYNTPELKNNYAFIPYGIRHDNPLYSIGELPAERLEALELFNSYCMSADAQEAASKLGFNQLDEYASNIPDTDGNTWAQMQKLWKKQKNAAKPIAAVFVIDTSGSMSGEPLNLVKSSLTNSLGYINESNYIGMIDYSSGVNIALPIAKFDINQKALFQGAVDGFIANGNTATYSAVAQAALMLDSFMAENPDVQPMIFLLSDGESRGGASYNSIAQALKHSKIPVYAIGYNEKIPELEAISALNEATCINATTDDVIYKLKNLFNASL